MQEFQTELSRLQEFPWTVATGDDEKHLRARGELPPKEPSRAETFINWSGPSQRAFLLISLGVGAATNAYILCCIHSMVLLTPLRMLPCVPSGYTRQPSGLCFATAARMQTFLLRRYFMQAIRLAMKDAQVRTGLAVVNHMIEPPAALFQPAIASKVLLLAMQDAFTKLRGGLQGREAQRA